MGIGRDAARTAWPLAWRRVAIPLLAAGVVLALSGSTDAAYLNVGHWSAEAEFGARWLRDEYPDETNDTRRFDQVLRLRNSWASLVDPRLFRFSVGGIFGYAEEQGFEGALGGSGPLLGYDFEGLLFGGRAENLTLYANRMDGTVSTSQGGSSDTHFERRGGTFTMTGGNVLNALGFRDFTARVNAYQTLTREKTTWGNSLFERDDLTNAVELDLWKGFETADLDLDYTLEDYHDYVRDDGSYRSQRGNLRYSLDFGPTLNRRWDSRLLYFDRQGTRWSSYVTLDQRLRIDHSQDLASTYGYLFTRSDADSVGQSMLHSGFASVRYQLYSNLYAEALGTALWDDYDDGDQKRYSGVGNLNYVRSLPGGGQIHAGASFSEAIEDDNYASGSRSVVDEEHLAPPVIAPGMGFLLDQRLVDPATIEVYDVRANVLTTEGIDYVVITEGDRTRIVPLASSLIIRPGDLLQVSYTYMVAPSITFSTTTWSISVGLDYPWIALNFSHLEENQSRISGQDENAFLQDLRLDVASLTLRRDGEKVRGESIVEYEIYDSTVTKYNSWRLRQSLTYEPVHNLLTTIALDEAFRDYSLPDQRTQAYAALWNLHWATPLPGLAASTYASYAEYRGSDDSADDAVARAGIDASWSYRQITLTSDFGWSHWRKQGLDEFRAGLRLIRRFF